MTSARRRLQLPDQTGPSAPLHIVGEHGADACAAQRSLRLQRGDHVLQASAEKARQCLAGRSLLFVGDSITRYQYISLITLLETGQFPERCTRAHDPLAEPSGVRERDWGNKHEGWSTFYRNVSEIRLNGNERCDCLAIGTKRTPTGKTARQLSSCAKAAWHNIDRPENRYYSTSDGQTNVTFFFATCGKEDLCTWRCNSCWPETTASFDHLLLNAGIFSGFSEGRCYEQFMRSTRARFLADAGQASWKTTNYPAGYTYQRVFKLHGGPSAPGRGADENRVQSRAAAATGFSVLPLDVLDGLIKQTGEALNTSMQWDQFHYEPVAYEFFNLLYLEQLCGGSWALPAPGPAPTCRERQRRRT